MHWSMARADGDNLKKISHIKRHNSLTLGPQKKMDYRENHLLAAIERERELSFSLHKQISFSSCVWTCAACVLFAFFLPSFLPSFWLQLGFA